MEDQKTPGTLLEQLNHNKLNMEKQLYETELAAAKLQRISKKKVNEK